MKNKTIHASVFTDASEIVSHLVGLKDINVLAYIRRGPVGEILIEQKVSEPTYLSCSLNCLQVESAGGSLAAYY